MEDTPGGNNSAIERAKKFVSDLAKRVKSSDSKVHETLTTKAVGSDQITDTRAPHFVIDDIIMPIFFEEDEFFSFPIHGSVEVPEFVPAMTLENSLDLTYVTELNESGYKTDASGFPGYKTDANGFPGYKTDASGFPGYKTDANGFPGYKTDASGFPGYKTDANGFPVYKTDASGFPGYKTDANGFPGYKTDVSGFPGYKTNVSGFPGYKTDASGFLGYKADASARLSLNSTDEKLDSDYSAIHYDDQFCSFSRISPASFNLNPISSLYADRCIEETYVDDGRSWSQPHFVIDATTMPIFFQENELFSFPIHESDEVPEFVPEMALENSLDLTYVTELDESVFSGYETDARKLNSTDEKLDSDYSAKHYDDQFCSFSCISPASFNLNPTSSLYADRCIAETYVDDGRSWSQQSCSSDELDSFFDVSVLQNEQCSTYVKRTVV